MQFIEGFLLISSLTILFSIAVYSFFHRRVPGAWPLFIQMITATVWTIGSFFEIITPSLEGKILWRNFQQIGVFIVPISNVFFAAEYSKQKKLKRYLYFLTVIPISALLLIFTNEYHHIMRSGYSVIPSPTFGTKLLVHSTIVGSLLVSVNFCIPLLAIGILMDFRKRVSNHYRKGILWIIISIALSLVFGWIKNVYLYDSDFYLPTPVLYIPSALILFFTLFRYSFFSVSPVARDKVFEIIGEGIIVVDEEEKIIDINSHGIELLNRYFYTGQDIISKKVTQLFIEQPKIMDLLLTKGERVIEVEVVNNNTMHCISWSSYPLFMGNEEQVGAVFIVNDVTDKKLYELYLKAKADKDSLTGLLNRNGFKNTFKSLLGNVADSEEKVTVFMMDLDKFKKINDTYGHINGDKVLKHFSKVIKETLRGEDIVGRIGGEEFAVILPGMNKYDGFNVAERIRKVIEKETVEISEEERISYTVSIGITDNFNTDTNYDNLIHKADMALYEAKRTSRNCTIISKD